MQKTSYYQNTHSQKKSLSLRKGLNGQLNHLDLTNLLESMRYVPGCTSKRSGYPLDY